MRHAAELTCVERTEVALLIAADIRMDPSDSGRDVQVARINSFTRGSTLFIHTDAAYAEDVRKYFPKSTVRYVEDEEEGPGDEWAGGAGRAGGTMVQWWRLGRAWKLLTDYETECGYAHEFVMKMRTDAYLLDNPPALSSVYSGFIKPTFGNRLDLVAFLSSDRFFAGSHSVFEQLSTFQDHYLTTYADQNGMVGTCDVLARVYAHAGTTPKAGEYGLTTNLTATPRGDCIRVESPPACAGAKGAPCTPTPPGRRVVEHCPVHNSDDLGDATWLLPTHSFGHGGAVVDMTDAELATARGNYPGYACLFKGDNKGGSELMFTYHAFFSRFAVRSITGIDTNIWSEKKHSLYPWRHQIHLWEDGFTVEEGTLQSFELTANAALGAAMHSSPDGCVTEEQLLAAAVATAREAKTSRHFDTRLSKDVLPGVAGPAADEPDDEPDDEPRGCKYVIDRRSAPHRRS